MRKSTISLIALLMVLGSFWLGLNSTSAQGQTGSLAAPAASPPNAVFVYQGRLEREGNPVTGTCSMIFKLMDSPAGAANQIGPALTKSVAVSSGLFTVELNFGLGAFTGASRFLDITVNCGSGAETLAPRQALHAAPYALGLLPITAMRYEGTSLTLINCPQGLAANGMAAPNATDCSAIAGQNESFLPTAEFVNLGVGSAIESTSRGAYATIHAANTGSGRGMEASAGNNHAIYASNNSAYATVYASSNATGPGVQASAARGNAFFGQNGSTSYPTADFRNTAAGPVLSTVSYAGDLLQGWEQLSAGGTNYNLRFRVRYNGNVYADGTYSSPAADLAELLPAAAGLEPGDVLVIGPDARLRRSDSANATHIAGVFATRPAFLGGMAEGLSITSTGMPAGPSGSGPDAALAFTEDVPVGLKSADDHLARLYREQGLAPLTIVGIVPVKVSAENGPIRPGDLLTSASLPGHAMVATPVEIGGIALYRPGTIIGKALGELTAGVGTIQVLVTLQ